MSNEAQKADSIAYRFYYKLTLVISNARETSESAVLPKSDKWFNLETPDYEPAMFKDSLRIYRSVSMTPPPPPFELQVLLSIPELTNKQVLVHIAPDSSQLRIEPSPSHILLESWILSFNPNPAPIVDIALPTIYKHGIPLFRSIYSLLRILPSWKLFKRLRRRQGNNGLTIQVRPRRTHPGRVLGFGSPPAAGSSPLPTESHSFPPVPHPMGTLSLTATCLTTPNFQIDEKESHFSLSHFLSMDEGPEFTPTLVKNQQRDSISGSPGSLPARTSLPKSPASSIADRFVLPQRHERTGSLPLSNTASPRNTPLQISRLASGASSNSPGSAGSPSKQGQDAMTFGNREEIKAPSGLAERLRKESLGSGRGGGDLPSLPSLPSPILNRRPSINPVHPFKSSTLSNNSPSSHLPPAPSLRASPLSSAGNAGFPTLPGRPPPTSPTSSRLPPSPSWANRQLPAIGPSSLGARSDAEDVPRRPTRKRYSSSFGHRYAATGGAESDISTGSAERRDGERVGSASFLSANTDDDDISMFVQDIDSRKPLSGRHRSVDLDESYDRDRTVRPRMSVSPHRRIPMRPSTSTSIDRESGIGGSTMSSVGAMLTNESDVEEELRKMNETFLASLEGLGSGGSARRRRYDSEGSSGSRAGPSSSSFSARVGASGGGGGGGGGGVPIGPVGAVRMRLSDEGGLGLDLDLAGDGIVGSPARGPGLLTRARPRTTDGGST